MKMTPKASIYFYENGFRGHDVLTGFLSDTELKSIMFDGKIFAFLKDGEFSIDNLAERTIRKLTTQRNSSLHYGSDAGVEMAATYHSVIRTVKLHRSSSCNFFGTFFKNIFHGCRDYVNMVPDKITFATG